MKTAHQFARELLSGPDHAIFHFDPSCAGFHPDDDSSITEPRIEVVDSEIGEDDDGNPAPTRPFITIVGDQHEQFGLDEAT